MPAPLPIRDPWIMGAYLSAPDTRKESEAGQSRDGFRYGCSSMQGWRRSQEDAHLVADLPEGTTVFGVFDGHGGREVSNFAKLHLAEALASQPTFSSDLAKSLAQSFHRVDELLEDKSNLTELRALKKNPHAPGDGPDDSADNSDEAGSSARRNVSMSEAVGLFEKLVSIKRNQQAAGSDSSAASGGTSGGGTATNSLTDSKAPTSSPPPAGDTGGNRVCTLPPSHVDAGATSIVAALRGKTLYVANAGDSRAILSRRGKAIPLSTDHKPALKSEQQRIQKAGGWVTAQGRINGNLNLSRALGDLKYKADSSLGREEQIITAQPDVTTHSLVKGDEFMVLACDGIWDCMTNQQVVDFVRERMRSSDSKLSDISEAILDHCIAKDPKTTGGIGGDNMTCIIVDLHAAAALAPDAA